VSGERARLFVALELPPEVGGPLVEWRDTVLGNVEGVRPIARENLHVTLCFLGWREQGEIERIAGASRVLADRGPVALTLGEAVLLPRRRPRVLAVGLDDRTGELAAAQSALAAALVAGGWYEREDRLFHGHVTVARAGRSSRIPRSAVLGPEPPRVSFDGTRVALYRSRLRRGGAAYEVLASVELGG
jgi:RNA 2',3'-cyclic 3'-phosphodiesterase